LQKAHGEESLCYEDLLRTGLVPQGEFRVDPPVTHATLVLPA